MDYDYEGVRGRGNDRIQCRTCRRHFSREALARHQPICARTAQNNRRVFDSSKQRVRGTGANAVRKRPDVKPKRSSWRQQHEEFVNMVRAARGVTRAMKRGGPLPPPPPPTLNPDYVQCDYCGRRFNETAAKRHIPFCREQHQRLPRMNTSRTPAPPPPPPPPPPTYSRQMEGKKTVSRPNYLTAENNSARYLQSVGHSNPNTEAKRTSYSQGFYSNRDQRNAALTSQPQSPQTNRKQTMMNTDHDTGLHGKPLRTGRSAETYYEGRQLGAMQKTHSMSPQSGYVSSRSSLYGPPRHLPTAASTTPHAATHYRPQNNGYASDRSGRQHAPAAVRYVQQPDADRYYYYDDMPEAYHTAPTGGRRSGYATGGYSYGPSYGPPPQAVTPHSINVVRGSRRRDDYYDSGYDHGPVYYY